VRRYYPQCRRNEDGRFEVVIGMSMNVNECDRRSSENQILKSGGLVVSARTISAGLQPDI
jgi:hypothetical protein